ncbi:MAG: hypothetical protein H6669_15860 [Ardenticatenaceae bacterium]|nr:hypothetical protein [Ardenticatenaceae bacterium]
MPWWGSISVLGWFLALNIVPVSCPIAVMRHRLWDTTSHNRTLVAGVLTAVTIGLYACRQRHGAPPKHRPIWLVAFIATGLRAVFSSHSDRLQHSVNRSLHGHRDEPLSAGAAGQRLEDALAPELVLPTLVETIAQTLKLPFVF